MGGIYPIFYSSLEDVQKMLSKFPPAFAAAFGMSINDLFSYGGFFSLSYVYLSLVGAIMAVSFAVSSFAREKRAKCSDFLLTKPVSRFRIFNAKLLANLSLLILCNLFFVVAVIAVHKSASPEEGLTGQMVLAAMGLFFTQIVFYTIGIFFATFAKKIRSVSGIATAFGFGGFILSALYNIFEKEILRYAAPLKYFNTSDVFENGGFDARYVITAGIVVVAGLLVSYWKYCKSDSHAV